MRRLMLVVFALLLLPSGANAYHLGGKRWPGGVVTYHASVPAYAQAVRDAVDAWNSSGARVHLRPAPAGRADLQIRYGKIFGSPVGIASLGRLPRHEASLNLYNGRALPGTSISVLCGRTVTVPDFLPGPRRQKITCLRGANMLLEKPRRTRPRTVEERIIRAVIVTHEFGHVLGLEHNMPACSVMSYSRDANCPKPAPGFTRCRLVERDDVSGVLARYGGSMSPLGREFCELAPVPPKPAALTAVRQSDGGIEVAWDRPANSSASAFRLASRAGSCPDRVPAEGQALPRELHAVEVIKAPSGSGDICVAVWHANRYGRVGEPATAVVTAASNTVPKAGFDVTQKGLTITADDTSFDADGTIAAQAWSFGDGATARGASVQHTYAQPGTYTVSLTVTDDRGAQSAATRTVTVSEKPNQPPVADFSFQQAFDSLSVDFENDSADPDGTIAAVRWAFGDGATSAEGDPTHTYAAPGTYSVTLTVTDDRGATSTATRSVTVDAPQE